MGGIPWWAWIILAGILGWTELHIPGSYLIWIALGAAITGLLAGAAALSFSAQIGIFAIACAASCAAGYFVYRMVGAKRRGEIVLNERSRLMLGMRGIVCETFVNGQGKVRLGDGVWLAAGADMAEGTPVVVTSAAGTRVRVERLDPKTVAAVARDIPAR